MFDSIRLPPAEQFMAVHRHASLGRLSKRTMGTGSATLGDAADWHRRGLYGSIILRHHRECVPRSFPMLDLGRTGSHHHGHIRRIENDFLREVSRRADPDDASIHIDCGRTIGGHREVSIGCQEQGKEHAADE